MLIANPIYDTVFKYLLDDDRVAKLFISTIIGSKVVDVKFTPKERVAQIHSLGVTIFRLDFSAVILTEEGEYRNVLIELQKADGPDDIRRFRKYLAENYYDKTPPAKKSTKDDLYVVEEAVYENCYDSFDPNKTSLPIITIYILGKPLRELKGHSAIKIKRSYYDAVTGKIIKKREPFIESLTHDSFVVQLTELKERRRNLLEQMFSVFEQIKLQRKAHFKDFDEQIPQEFQPILERLSRAALDRDVLEEMIVEDEILDNWKNKERKYEKQIEEKESLLNEALRQKQEALRQKEEECRQKEAGLKRENKLLKQLADLKKKLKHK